MDHPFRLRLSSSLRRRVQSTTGGDESSSHIQKANNSLNPDAGAELDMGLSERQESGAVRPLVQCDRLEGRRCRQARGKEAAVSRSCRKVNDHLVDP